MPIIEFLKNPSAGGISLFHNLGFLILGLLIPFSILIFQELSVDKKSELDRRIFFDDIFAAKKLLVNLLIIFLVPFTWKVIAGISNSTFFVLINSLSFLLFFYCFYKSIDILVNVFKWIIWDENKKWEKFRLKYLEKSVNISHEEQKIIWTEIWKQQWGDDKNLDQEKTIFLAFKKCIDNLIKEKKNQEVDYLLDIFLKYFSETKRNKLFDDGGYQEQFHTSIFKWADKYISEGHRYPSAQKIFCYLIKFSVRDNERKEYPMYLFRNLNKYLHENQKGFEAFLEFFIIWFLSNIKKNQKYGNSLPKEWSVEYISNEIRNNKKLHEQLKEIFSNNNYLEKMEKMYNNSDEESNVEYFIKNLLL